MIQIDTGPVVEGIPVVCTLAAAEQAQRGGAIAPLFGEVQETRELPDGYALRFPGDATWAARLLALIAEERACCPFFTFALVFEPMQGPLWLSLRGPEGTKEFVASMLAAVAARQTPFGGAVPLRDGPTTIADPDQCRR